MRTSGGGGSVLTAVVGGSVIRSSDADSDSIDSELELEAETQLHRFETR